MGSEGHDMIIKIMTIKGETRTVYQCYSAQVT